MDYSTPSFPIYHQLPELAQTHVRQVGDAIQPLVLCRSLLLLPSVFPSIRVQIFPNQLRDLRVMLSKKERWKELTVKLIKCHALKIAARLEEEWGLWFKQSAPNFQIRL